MPDSGSAQACSKCTDSSPSMAEVRPVRLRSWSAVTPFMPRWTSMNLAMARTSSRLRFRLLMSNAALRRAGWASGTARAGVNAVHTGPVSFSRTGRGCLTGTRNRIRSRSRTRRTTEGS